MLALRSLRRFSETAALAPVITESDQKRLRRIEAPRRALILEHQKAAKEGRIIPMIHILEKCQEAIKSPNPTPMQKLENTLKLQATDSFDLFLEKKKTYYGSFGLQLYGSEKDNRFDALMNRGEIVPAVVRNEVEMLEYRRYFMLNFNVPGVVESINPNKFIRMKPVEEFAYLPIIPISPSTLDRYKTAWKNRREIGFRFNIDKAKAWSAGIGVMCFIAFLALIYLLYRTDEESWVAIEQARVRTRKNRVLL